MNIFISYSNADIEIARELEEEIISHGIECFRDETHIEPGKNINEAVKQGLNRASGILVLLSNASIQSSWVAYEVGMAEGKKIDVLPYICESSVHIPSFLSHLKYFKNIDEVITYLEPSNNESTDFSFNGWGAWGLKAKVTNEQSNEITLNGSFPKAAGYVVEGNLPYGGKKIKITVSGTKRCTFDQQKLFKFEVDDNPVKVKGAIHNYNDSDFINAKDGEYEIDLPAHFKKLQFVFWDSVLSDLVIKCELPGTG